MVNSTLKSIRDDHVIAIIVLDEKLDCLLLISFLLLSTFT